MYFVLNDSVWLFITLSRMDTKCWTITYSHEALLSLPGKIPVPPRDLPADIRSYRRGTQTGALVRQKRASNRRLKPYLPSVIIGNNRSLTNKSN